jgi:hypothetical protein
MWHSILGIDSKCLQNRGLWLSFPEQVRPLPAVDLSSSIAHATTIVLVFSPTHHGSELRIYFVPVYRALQKVQMGESLWIGWWCKHGLGMPNWLPRVAIGSLIVISSPGTDWSWGELHLEDRPTVEVTWSLSHQAQLEKDISDSPRPSSSTSMCSTHRRQQESLNLHAGMASRQADMYHYGLGMSPRIHVLET